MHQICCHLSYFLSEMVQQKWFHLQMFLLNFPESSSTTWSWTKVALLYNRKSLQQVYCLSPTLFARELQGLWSFVTTQQYYKQGWFNIKMLSYHSRNSSIRQSQDYLIFAIRILSRWSVYSNGTWFRKNSHLRMADPAAAWNRKALNQNHKRGETCAKLQNAKERPQIRIIRRGEMCAKLQNAKKNSPNFFLLIIKNPRILYWLTS